MIKDKLSYLTKTERQELGKCYSNPIRYAKLLPKYQTLIDEIMSLGLADTLTESVHMILNDLSAQPLCKACQAKLVFKPATYTYGEYCNHTCRASFNNVEKDAIWVNGIRYDSIKDAMNATGESRYIIKQRLIQSVYRYVDDHDAKIAIMFKDFPISKDELIEKKQSGMTLAEITNQLGIPRNQLDLFIMYHQIDTKHEQIDQESVRNILRTKDDFVAMFEEMSMESMAKSLGVVDGTIRRYALEHGLDTARKGWNRSRGEIELFEYIRDICPSAVSSATPIPNSKLEADIYIEERKLAFEYNGCYTHSEKFKDRQYHKNKFEAFNNAGIRLVQIWEDDWDMNRGVVKKLINNILGVAGERIGARETSVGIIEKQQFDCFLNSNHMQGTTSANIMIGLFHDDNVVAVMGFSKLPSNNKKEYHGDGVLLTRFANSNVNGAFGKLLAYFRKTFSQYTHVITFADLEIVSEKSNVYTVNGFVEAGRLPVDYKYYKKHLGMRKHKFLFRKSRFASMGLSIDGKTEAELAEECGFLRCYDSGKIRYLKILQK